MSEDLQVNGSVELTLRLQPEKASGSYWLTLAPGLWIANNETERVIGLTLQEALAVLEWLKAREEEIHEAIA